jgi:exosortase K
MKTKNLIYYIIICSTVIIAKALYANTTNDTLVFILNPLSSVVSLVTDSSFSYSNDIGFYFKNLNIAIDKSCSGINFWLISFVAFSILILKVCKSHLQKTLSIPLMLIATFVLTLFANTSRILTAIFISKQTTFDYPWLHQAQGVFIYLSLLILVYTIANQLLSKFNSYDEKLT